MDYLDVIGWVGNIFFLLGAILIAYKKKYGLLCNTIANLFYIYMGYFVGKSSLFILSIVLASINAVGFYYWRKNDK